MSGTWKQYVRLKMKKHREAARLFLVEGARLCREALLSGWPVEAALVSEKFRQNPAFGEFEEYLRQQRVKPQVLAEGNLKRLCDTEHPQGIVLVMKMPEAPEAKKWARKHPDLVLLLDGIRDPGNLGTLLRTADWFGVDRIFSSADSVDFYNPKVLRASMGSFFRIPFAEVPDLAAVVAELKQRHFLIVGTTLRRAKPLESVAARPPLALILGGEAMGVSPRLQSAADLNVGIQKFGEAESLNVAVAGGIVLHYFTALQKRPEAVSKKRTKSIDS